MIIFDLLKYAFIAKQEARLSKQQIKDLQITKFRKLVRFISQKSPYYKNIIKKYNIDSNTCKPEDFPVLTKTDIIENFDRIVTDPRITKEKISQFLEQSKNSNDLFLNKYYIIHTSGSSGTVGYYVYSENELLRGVANITLGNSLQLFQKFAFIGAVNSHFAGATMANLAKKLPILYFSVKTFDTNVPFQDILNGLNTMQPTSISGYVFILKKLAEAQEAGKLHIKPTTLQVGGEPLYTRDKTYIEKIFHAPILNVYAASEHFIMGLGKDIFEGMYLMENNMIFEIKSSSTIVTNLYNYTLPLIRYQMSDRLEPINDTKHLLPFTKVSHIVGRNEYIPVFLNNKGEEDFIRPLAFTDIIVKHVDKLQIHILDKENFLVKISLVPKTSRKEATETVNIVRKQVHAILDEKLMTHVKFDVQIVDRLWADQKTGKFQLIILSKKK